VTDSSLDLDKITAAISALELGVDATELHGGLCGLLCTQGAGAVTAWIRGSSADHRARSAEAAAAADQLYEAEAETWRELNDPNLVWYPLLPDEQAELSERVAGLALWCQGFVTGLGLGAYSTEAAAFEDDPDGSRTQIAEILDDFVEISRAGLGADEIAAADKTEFDLAALIEYVRVGVQLVFEHLHRQRQADTGADEPLSRH